MLHKELLSPKFNKYFNPDILMIVNLVRLNTHLFTYI